MVDYRPSQPHILSLYLRHGRIIKWTQHIGFLTLAGMGLVIEGNHEKNSKRKAARILCLSKFDYSLYFYFYEHKQNKCMHVLYCGIITIK